MNPRWRHRVRRTWFTAGGVLAALVIALAVLLALGQLLLPLAAHYPDRVAQMLSQRLHRSVHFDSMRGYWQPSGPMLVLQQVEIGRRNGQPALTLPTARVKLDFGALLWPSRHWINLRLSGLKLSLQRDAAGHWHVAGFGVAGKGRAQHLTLDDLPGNLWLDDLEVDIDDARSGHHYHLHVGPLRVSNGGGELRFAGLLRPGSSAHALKVAGHVTEGGSSGRLYLAADDADLGAMFADASVNGYAVTSGHGDLALWLRWHDRRLTGASARVDLENLALQSPAGPVTPARLHGLVQYRRDGDQARLLFAPDQGGALRVDVSGIGADTRVVARAQNLDSGHWLTLGALVPAVPAAQARWLAAATPRVHLATARLHWSRAQGIEALLVRFDHLGFGAAGGRPGVDHLYGVLRGDAAALSLELPSQPVTLDFAGMFRQPLAFASLGGSVSAWRDADAWHVASAGIQLESEGLEGQLRGSIRMPADGSAPHLELYALLEHASVAAAKRFWPVGIMPRKTVQWLDRGLIGGSLDSARVIVRGSMADWPFTAQRGRFEAHADISGLALDYDPHWPRATNISVGASFVANGLLAVVTAGEVHGVKVKRAVASIPNFHKPELILSAQGSGKGGALMDIVRTSPIGASHGDVLDKLKLGGRADFHFSMVVPLSTRAPDPFTLGGTVRLHDADVDAPAWQLHLDGLDGALTFNGHGFAAHDLAARFHGQPVTLDMAVGPQTGRPDWPVKIAMRGRFSLAQLADGRQQLEPLVKVGSGSALFNIGFHIDRQAANALHSKQVLRVRSNLRGIKLGLPAPLDKPAPARWTLEVQLGFPFAGGPLRVALDDRVHARARLPSKQRPGAVDVRLGGVAPSGPMPASGIRVRGNASDLDISGWVRHALSAVGGAGGDMPVIDVDVTADHTHIFGQEFNKLRIKLNPAPNELELAVTGADIQGTVTVPVHGMDKRGIVARFDRLYWPSPAGASAAAPETIAPGAAPPTPAQAAAVGVAPSALPPLHVWVGDLRLGDARLGHVRLESWPTTQGMHIGMLRAQSSSMNIDGSGDWVGTAQSSHTHMVINFSAENLGHMLDAFGYDGLITGGKTHAHFDATWPGAPYSFALANVEGVLTVSVGEGRIPEVKPGMGRLFALMSIAELPRRLTLDFGDVFGKGFGFDSMTGHFRFHDGNAWTQDFTLKASAAKILVTGRVGFRTHDYDQYVLAIPHLGNSLPIVGAVVGGPVGAAAGLAIKGLLGKGLNRSAAKRYHISGPWSQPDITEIQGDGPLPTPGPSPAGSTAPVAAAAVSVRPIGQPAPAASTH